MEHVTMSRASEALPSPWVGADGHLPLPWLEMGLSAALSQRGHALLVHGPEGVGQFELAMVLAQSVLCEAPVPARAPTGAPCGHCEACHLLQAGAHPDLMVLVPEALRESLGLSLASAEGEGGEGGAATGAVTKSKTAGREIRVADVRRAIDWGHQTSSRGRGKVLVLHPAQALNLVAGNALLKTLEEPAGALRLILSTADPQALLPTLRSRCQQVQLAMPAPEISARWLEARGVDDARAVLAAAGGRPQEALAMVREGLDARRWPELPDAVRQGRAELFHGLTVPRVVDLLQKICLDLMSRAQGARATYFPEEALPAGAQAQALAAWWTQLQRTARHEDHPWNAALLIESLVLQGRRCWPVRDTKKPYVR
jgi:DNA polymerase-3 subunit delta'